MPTYEYQCFSCEHRFETQQRISADPLTLCPECGKEELKRLISQTAFHLKGSGWYKTDYAASGSSSTGESDSAATSSSDNSDKSAKTSDSSTSSTPSDSSSSTKDKSVEKKSSSKVEKKASTTTASTKGKD